MITLEMQELALCCAKGSWQRGIVEDLVAGRAIFSPPNSLRGRALSYKRFYVQSFASLLSRLEKSGVSVVRTAGPRGGEWSATYQIG